MEACQLRFDVLQAQEGFPLPTAVCPVTLVDAGGVGVAEDGDGRGGRGPNRQECQRGQDQAETSSRGLFLTPASRRGTFGGYHAGARKSHAGARE